MKKIVVFSGAGLDQESGIPTYRDGKNGLWNNYSIEDIATPEGWSKNREKVLDFYNSIRRELPNNKPNLAHKALLKLETKYDVYHVTQNVSDLLQRTGVKNVVNLHGELTKARGSAYRNNIIPKESIIDIGYNDINIGDKCKISGSQLRPNLVFFNEYPQDVDRAYRWMSDADILLIVGTSLQIGYTLSLISNVRKVEINGKPPCRIIYVDPKPMEYLEAYGLSVEYIKNPATKGVTKIVKELLK